MMDAKTAIATLEAFIAGGDELGDVPEQDALSALQVVRERIDSLRNWWASDLCEKDRQLAAANVRIAELEAQLDSKVDALMHNMVLRERVATLEAQLSKPATIHEVIDDFGYPVTSVTL